MEVDEILNAAREATGLPDPQTDSWRQGLQILLRDHLQADLLSERGYLREHPVATDQAD